MMSLLSRPVSCLVVAVVVAVSCLVSVCGQPHYPDVYKLGDYCGDSNSNASLAVDKSIIIKAHNIGTGLGAKEECFVNLHPKTGDRLVANFTSYKIDPLSGTVFSGPCYDIGWFLVGETGNLLPSHGYCRLGKPSGHYDLGKEGSFGYKLFNFFAGNPEAELLVSEVTDKKNEACPDGFFDCNNKNYCIVDSLTCNAFNDCGNNDDETEVCHSTDTTLIG